MDRLPDLAADLVRLKVDIIVADGTLATQAESANGGDPDRDGSGRDPVGTGLIATLARPSGNVTGVSSATADLVESFCN